MKSKPNGNPRPNEPPASAEDLAEAVRLCQADAEFLRQLQDIYRRADQQIERLGAGCLGGGSCCKFDLAGHRLYVSTGELALLTRLPPPNDPRRRPRRCPYQQGPRCVARERRPLGCRTFFCEKKLSLEIRELCEHLHGQIRSAHQIRCLPYCYVELVAGMMQLVPTK